MLIIKKTTYKSFFAITLSTEEINFAYLGASADFETLSGAM